MGSIKDFGQFRPRQQVGRWEEKGSKPFVRRLLRQTAAAVLLLLMVAAGVNGENRLGEGARFVVQTVSGQGESWLPSPGTPVLAGQDGEGKALENTVSQAGEEADADINGETDGTIDGEIGGEAESQPVFTAPASGVVVTDVTATVDGFSSQQGIFIQGNAGQNVKAAADGQVQYLGTTEEGYLIEISHNAGFTSVYSGLSSISVTAGESVDLGQAIGATSSGELTFSLLLEGVEVDPLAYLFE